ncbi:MAG: DUF3387 domain-containing protein [Methanosarcina barkeri]|nr:DUF3387 domain-containing protein [Methanosarcina sp. ERenArc_MAG2]
MLRGFNLFYNILPKYDQKFDLFEKNYLADNESALELLGNETLRLMAAELVKIIRQNAGVDWALRKNIQAKIKVNVKRLLKKYGYPPDKQKLATENILKQAELLCIGGEHLCPIVL